MKLNKRENPDLRGGPDGEDPRKNAEWNSVKDMERDSVWCWIKKMDLTLSFGSKLAYKLGV